MSSKKKVAVALSGGIDSSVCALLLKKQGFDVVGITGKMTNDNDSETVCQNAKAVAEKLDIEHYVLDLSEDFQKNIIDYFINSYKNGETPNPCIFCNKKIKWGAVFDYAINSLGCDYMATGHYANIINKDGQFLLYPAKDTKKDQLYYLFELNQNQLSKTIFPLKDLQKPQIREIAAEYDLPSKSSKESQDICFIRKPCTVKKFLLQHLEQKSGDFVLKKTGEVIGKHDGFSQYTIGQRKGIGIAYSEPLYVIGTDAARNIVYCGTKDELFSDKLVLDNYSLQDKTFEENLKNGGAEVLVKIRYNMQPVAATIIAQLSTLKVVFIEPVSAVTKGQACVFYSKTDGHLIGGGWI